MIQDRNGNLLHSLLSIFRKSGKHDELEAQDPSALESRRKLEQRIELALGDISSPLQTAPELPGSRP
jgi:hypothetical protein